MKIVQKTVPSSDGKHTLQGVVYVPDGEIRGLVQVVHGMCEYTGRYEAFMTFLAENGYLAFGHDHLGHGLTAAPEERGFIAERDGWEYLVRDVTVMKDAVVREYGDRPWYLFGHSMGSFIVRCAVAKGARPRKLIVCTDRGTFEARCSLLEMEKTLDPETFVRISRFEIINMERVSSFDVRVSGTIRVTFDDGSFAWVARRYVHAIEQRLEHLYRKGGHPDE